MILAEQHPRVTEAKPCPSMFIGLMEQALDAAFEDGHLQAMYLDHPFDPS